MFLRLDGAGRLSVVLASLLLSSPLAHCTEVDPRAEVAAALYAASTTQAASELLADAKLHGQRKDIEQLRVKISTGAKEIERLRSELATMQSEVATAQQLRLKITADDAEAANLRSQLASAEEKYVADLAGRDRAYREEIAVFRAQVQDIASTREGAAALARFNAGDAVGAVAILDGLTKARDKARQKREQIEAAADRRPTAYLVLDAREKGKFTTEQAIARFEEVTRLDPGVLTDWVQLCRLYEVAGRVQDARVAAEHAAETAESELARSV